MGEEDGRFTFIVVAQYLGQDVGAPMFFVRRKP